MPLSKINAYCTNCHVMHILSRVEAAASLAFNVSVEPYIMVRGEAVGIEEQKIYRLNQPSRRHYSNMVASL